MKIDESISQYLAAVIPAAVAEWCLCVSRCMWTLYAYLSLVWTMVVLRVSHFRRQRRLRRKASHLGKTLPSLVRRIGEEHQRALVPPTPMADNPQRGGAAAVPPTTTTLRAMYEGTREVFAEARYNAVDEKIRRALTSQATREQHLARPSPVLALLPPPNAQVVNWNGFSLTAAAAASLIDQVASCIGAELFSFGSSAGDLQPNSNVTHHNVLMMLPNCAHYVPLWAGIAQSANILNLLSTSTVQRDGRSLTPQPPVTGPSQRSFGKKDRNEQNHGSENRSKSLHSYEGVSHSCSTTLLNTNLTSNEMLCRSIEASSGNILILDQCYARLLFPNVSTMQHQPQSSSSHSQSTSSSGAKREKKKNATAADAQRSPPPLAVHLPSCIKKIFLWDSSQAHLGEFHAHANQQQRANSGSTNGSNNNSRVSAHHSKQHASQIFPLTVAHVEAILDYNDVHASPRRSFRGDGPMANEAISNTLLWARLWLSNVTLFPKDIDERIRALLSPPQVPADAYNPYGFFFAQQQHQQLLLLAPYSFPDEVLSQLDVALSPSLLRSSPSSLVQAAIASFSLTDVLVRIYTSGTTGLPKAAKFSHSRFYIGFSVSKLLQPLQSTKRMLTEMHRAEDPRSRITKESMNSALRTLTAYNCLPMYHSAGGIFCVSHWLHMLELQQSRRWVTESGDGRPPTARLLIRSKFSASLFKSDIETYRVTVVQYIGEILRYAISAEQSDPSRHHHPEQPSDRPRAPSSSSSSSSSNVTTTAATVSSPRTLSGSTPLLRSSNSSSFPCSPAARKESGVGTPWKAPIAMGNGLRPDQWQAAQTLLPLHRIVEFYGSTEGNVAVFNWYGEPGAVGHLPLLPAPLTCLSPMYMWLLFPIIFVEFDYETEAPRRGANGWLRVCEVNQPGELLGRMALERKRIPDLLFLKRFDGYSGNPAETQKKILRSCFRANDSYFRSGDLLRYDARGFVYFVDRVGDTFRWKGENVSTCEVSECLNRVQTVNPYGVDGHRVSVKQSIVYGIAVPGREGRAGAAKLSLQCQFVDRKQVLFGRPSLAAEEQFMAHCMWQQLSTASLPSSLPSYAIPVLLRVTSSDLFDCPADSPSHDCNGLSHSTTTSFSSTSSPSTLYGTTLSSVSGTSSSNLTTTFKFRKVELQAEGFDVAIRQPAPENELMDRFYVLCRKELTPEYIACASLPCSAKVGGGGGTASPNRREFCYLPLHAHTYPLIFGENFENCGW